MRRTIGRAMEESSIRRPVAMHHRLVMMLLSAAVVIASNDTLRGCPSRCGDVHIPYPFGIGPACSRKGFALMCTRTEDGRNKPFIFNVEVINISLPLDQARMYDRISWRCYNNTLKRATHNYWSLNLTSTPYRFSYARNKFTIIGCQTLAYILGPGNEAAAYESGCVSACHNVSSLMRGSCSGIGCCQTSIPPGLGYYQVLFDGNFNNSATWEFNHCSFAVLLEEDSFEFQSTYVTTLDFYYNNSGWPEGYAPFVVDWAIRDETCEQARRNPTAYACTSQHSYCNESSNGPGYLCYCSDGYQGNPYVSDGCQDIDECVDKERWPCSQSATCTNTAGNFTCSCPPGTHGNPQKGGACYTNTKLSLTIRLIIGISISLVILLSFYSCISTVHERRTIMRLKKRHFQQNGGWLLLHEIRSNQGLAFKIYTKEELEQATNKFDQNTILGRGGYGTVYKGILKGNNVVAIKKSKIIDERQKKEFGKEMIILSQINHKNVVKLLGCCLEVEVPMLIYEFVSNGTLFEFIHEKSQRVSISLDVRLKIASESAKALAYLHSSASPPIVHGDVKSSNILLDDNYTAKVSDFGASILVPMDETQCATLVQGTIGYLDPEYLQTYQLTDKSDVYSFGVVLLELLTSKKALYFEGPEEERCLASIFTSAMKENEFLELLDSQIMNDGDMDVIQEVAELANQCLNVAGVERPSMNEVAEKLDGLRKFKLHPWAQHKTEETESLLGESSNSHETHITGLYSSEKTAVLEIESGT